MITEAQIQNNEWTQSRSEFKKRFYSVTISDTAIAAAPAPHSATPTHRHVSSAVRIDLDANMVY